MNKILLILLACAGILILSISLTALIALKQEPWKEKVAVIPIKGQFVEKGFLPGIDGGIDIEEIKSFIKDAEENPSVKAILFVIDSPGGSPVVSAELAESVKQARKPTVSWIGDVGASGAYWAASAANKVVAHRMSITGSIGAYTSIIGLEGLLGKYGISEQTIKSGEFKDIGSPFRNMTEEEKKIFQQMVDDINSEFIKAVSENRKKPIEEIKKIADGRPYLGKTAFELGLVDQLGTEKDAIKLAASLGNSTTEETITYSKEKGFLAQYIGSSLYYLGYGIGKGIFSNLNFFSFGP